MRYPVIVASPAAPVAAPAATTPAQPGSLMQALNARKAQALARITQAEPAYVWRFQCTFSTFVSCTCTLEDGSTVIARVYDDERPTELQYMGR